MYVYLYIHKEIFKKPFAFLKNTRVTDGNFGVKK